MRGWIPYLACLNKIISLVCSFCFRYGSHIDILQRVSDFLCGFDHAALSTHYANLRFLPYILEPPMALEAHCETRVRGALIRKHLLVKTLASSLSGPLDIPSTINMSRLSEVLGVYLVGQNQVRKREMEQWQGFSPLCDIEGHQRLNTVLRPDPQPVAFLAAAPKVVPASLTQSISDQNSKFEPTVTLSNRSRIRTRVKG